MGKVGHFLICSKSGNVLASDSGSFPVQKGDKLKIIKHMADGYFCNYLPLHEIGKIEPCYVFSTQIEGQGEEESDDFEHYSDSRDNSDLAIFYFKDNKLNMQERYVGSNGTVFDSCPECGKTIRNNKCGRCGYGLDEDWKEAVINKRKEIQAAQKELAMRRLSEASLKSEILQIAKVLKFPKPTHSYSNTVQWIKKGGHAGDKVVYRVIQAAKDLNWEVKKNKQFTHPAYDIVVNQDALVDPTGRFFLETNIKYGVAAYENSFSIRLVQIPIQESSTSICSQCRRTKASCLCPKTDQFVAQQGAECAGGPATAISEAEEVQQFDLGGMDYIDNTIENNLTLKTNITEKAIKESVTPLPPKLEPIKNKSCLVNHPELWSYYSDFHNNVKGFRPLDDTISVSEVWDFIQCNLDAETYEVCDKNMTNQPAEVEYPNDTPHWADKSLIENLQKVENIWKKKRLKEVPDISIETNPSGRGKTVMAGNKPLKNVTIEDIFENIVIFRQSTDNFMFSKGKTWGYFMDSAESARKIRSGEIDFLLFPITRRFNLNINPMDPWKHSKNSKGKEHILAVWDGWTDEDEIYVDKIAVRKPYRKASIATKMLDIFRKQYPNAKVTITGTTNDGQEFLSKYAKVPKNQIYKDGEVEVKNDDKRLKNNEFDKNMKFINPKVSEEEKGTSKTKR